MLVSFFHPAFQKVALSEAQETQGARTLTDPATWWRAEPVRHFNRFYTRYIGALHEQLHKSEFSLTEVRVLHELARGRADTASALARNLGLDSGYLSRLLSSFERRDLITRRPAEHDARQSMLALTEAGRAAYAPLDEAAVAEVAAVLEQLAQGAEEQLIGAMKLIERLLDDRPRHRIVTLRAPRPGELGWLVGRQAQLFSGAYGWNQTFEGMLAKLVAAFAATHDPQRETCWIAEQNGTVVGSALVAMRSDQVATVRLLYVEPDVQRLGIGSQLLSECVRFAIGAGYRKLAITTAGAQREARRLFVQTGFIRAATATEQRFGCELVVENWERDLEHKS
jgi:DNA-binding MarR family transcriptional regulator/N-acetylglutamate synthase-like GNAT family acetyltransferase